MIRIIFLSWLITLTANFALAAPVPYELDLKESKVVFFYDLSGQQNRGMFSVTRADTMVDLQDVRRSSLDVTISTRSVRAGDPVIGLALKGPDLLATGKHPTARFVSKRVTASADGVKILGDLTLKGVTKPVTLDAVFQRYANAPTDNSELILSVSGAVSRKAFGVVGFPELVSDTIRLNFRVHLQRE